ncbi:hypothetical protein N9B82_03780 [Saprospiraceae bacterium]|nr:hypothetical protein [Saprospiraceae bacterium]
MGNLEKKKGIDYRKVFSIIAALLLVMVAHEAVKFKRSSNFNKLEITIQQQGTERSLLTKKDVLDLMREHLGFDPTVANVDEVNFRSLEESLERNAYIQEALIYLNARHELIVLVQQRKPIARVMTNEVDYYVAADATKIPLSDYATLRVPIITGSINHISSRTKETKATYGKLVQLLNRCREDKFLTALIEQIDIDRDGKLTIIPKIGTERIVFGELENTEEKLKKLSKYYKWGRSQDGWDKYAYLNLEVKNQIALGK